MALALQMSAWRERMFRQSGSSCLRALEKNIKKHISFLGLACCSLGFANRNPGDKNGLMGFSGSGLHCAPPPAILSTLEMGCA